MKSIIYELTGPAELVRREVELPPPGVNEIVAKTIYSAISPGTEIAAWRGLPPLRPSKVYPRVVGYCNLARVLHVGAQVAEVREGDLVLTHQSHRSAFCCRREEILYVVGNAPTDLHKGLSATYLYHLAYAALLAAGFMPGHLVGVVGMGTLGLCLARLCKIFGGDPWMFSDQLTSTSDPSDTCHPYLFAKAVPPELESSTLGMGGLDVIVNTSNKWSDHELSMRLARKGGTIVCLGFPGRGEPPPPSNPLDSRFFYDKQLTIKHAGHVPEGSLKAIDARFTLERNMAYLAGLIATGAIDPQEVLSFEASWEDLAQVYARLSSRQTGIYSALLRWA
jgi:2-desacetyl-2-hydroxyethyl bacteriochlorophyllide A dehydrogenase